MGTETESRLSYAEIKEIFRRELAIDDIDEDDDPEYKELNFED